MKNFWTKLKNSTKGGQAIYALAPMAGYTDSAFRQICKQFGADVVYSEMASVEALCHNPQKTLKMLEFSKSERPYVVQLFGAKPKHFAQAVKLVEKKIKPDGIDINFGCPVRKVQKQGAGAVLMDNLKLARQIIKAAIASTKLPVAIKTRSQVGKTDVLKFLDYIKDLDVKCVMIHGRTLAQAHSGPVNYEIIKQARKYFKGIILANGGVYNFEDAQELLIKTAADGIGIAQGALGRPWIFAEVKTSPRPSGDPLLIRRGQGEVFGVMLEHAKLAKKIKGRRGIVEMRKHLCWYVKGSAGASEIRQELVRAKSFKEIEKILMDTD